MGSSEETKDTDDSEDSLGPGKRKIKGSSSQPIREVVKEVIKEVGVPQAMYDNLKQRLIDKEAELMRIQE